jgi:membrane protease YdiL (CAAX protease family)
VPILAWEILALGVLALLFVLLWLRTRRMGPIAGLVRDVAYAAFALMISLSMVVRLNGYGRERLGVGRVHLHSASCLMGLVTAAGIVALIALGRVRGRRTVLTRHMAQLMLVYPAWAYVQHLLVMGVFVNLVRDWLGMPVAVIAAGLVFGTLHWNHGPLFFALTFAIGLSWGWAFLSAPNLLPLAASHGVLATLTYYWIRGEDKWAEIFTRARPGG